MKDKIKNLLFDSQKGKIKLNDKASIFFFCLLLATFFWFLSSLSKRYTTTLSIPIEYTSFNKSFILMEEPVENLTIRVAGSGFELLGEQMMLNRKSIDVDLSTAKNAGSNRFAIATSSIKNELLTLLDKDLDFIEIQLDSIVLLTEPRITKTINVKTNLNLEFESGYDLHGEVIVEPSEVLVSGPKSSLDTLETIYLKELTISDLDDTTMINVKVLDDNIFEFVKCDPSSLKLTIPVEKFTEKIFEVPIQENVSVSETSIKTFPNNVKVVFSVPLSNYERLLDGDFIAAVEVGETELTQSKLKVVVKGFPTYAKLLRIEPEKVEYIIKK